MTSQDFYDLHEEGQYEALKGMTAEEARDLHRALLVEDRDSAYTRAARAIAVFHPAVKPGHPYYAERLSLETHYKSQAAHREKIKDDPRYQELK